MSNENANKIVAYCAVAITTCICALTLAASYQILINGFH